LKIGQYAGSEIEEFEEIILRFINGQIQITCCQGPFSLPSIIQSTIVKNIRSIVTIYFSKCISTIIKLTDDIHQYLYIFGHFSLQKIYFKIGDSNIEMALFFIWQNCK